MASTVAIQDCALQYEYLQPPTPINGFLFSICSLPLFYYPKALWEGSPYNLILSCSLIQSFMRTHGVNLWSLMNSNSYTSQQSWIQLLQLCSCSRHMCGNRWNHLYKYYTELLFNCKLFFDHSFNGEPLAFKLCHIFILHGMIFLAVCTVSISQIQMLSNR